MKKLFCLFLVFVLLSGTVSAGADPVYDGFIVSKFESDETTYYRLYSDPAETIGAPTFYREPCDTYDNIYTGWDVSITFFRQYDGVSLAQTKAFCRYLEETSEAEDRYAGYYCCEEDGFIKMIVVYLFEGWDFDDLSLDFQDLWQRNPWMNCDATGLVLEYLDYGLSEETLKWSWDIGCSAAVCVQEAVGFPGVSFGFRFFEGTDHHIVRRYCPDY